MFTEKGKVYYGVDCWCYSGGLGSTLIAVFIITLIIFFFVNGCIWACLFKCMKAVRGEKEEGFETGLHSLRASMRKQRSQNPI